MLCLAELSARVWHLINVTDSGWVTQSGMSLNQVDSFFFFFFPPSVHIFSAQLENEVFMV